MAEMIGKILSNSFHFKVGNINCVVIRDFSSVMRLESFFPDKPSEQLERLLNQYSIPHQETLELMCLLVRTEKNLILIDTGWGTLSQAISGKLIQNLQADGFNAQDIDTVILSHAHPDHIGGNTDAEGRPAFPNARYIIHKTEYDFWTSEPDLSQFNEIIRQEMLTAVHKKIIPVKGQLEFVNNEKGFIVDGIEFILASGHSPGHIVLTISSGSEQLLYIGDLAQHPLEFAQPDLCTYFDMMPEQASLTRRKILSYAVTTGSLIFSYHFPFPGLGHVIERERNVWLWQPITIDKDQ